MNRRPRVGWWVCAAGARWPRLLAIGWLLALSARTVGAQGMDGLGVRALGMAGAFVAVADDATAVYWNPAGLPTGDFFSALAEHQGIDGGAELPGVVRGSGSAILVALPPLGVGYYRLRAPGSGLTTHHIPVTLVQSIGDHVNVGAALKAVRAGETRFDADLGVMLRFTSVRAGLVVRHLTEPTFTSDTGGLESTLARQVRAGLALMPRDGLTLSADADLTRTPALQGERRDLALGAEQRLHPRGYLRGGLRLQTVEDLRPAVSIGGSVAITSLLWVDAQVSRGADAAGGSWGIGLRARF